MSYNPSNPIEASYFALLWNTASANSTDHVIEKLTHLSPALYSPYTLLIITITDISILKFPI